jgi:hypothetical protein
MPVYVDSKVGHMIDIDWRRVYRDDASYHIDVDATIDIQVYTKFLAMHVSNNWTRISQVVDMILEIRGWFWESYLNDAKNFPGITCAPGQRNIMTARLASVTSQQMHELVIEFVKPLAESIGLGVSDD